MTLILPLSWAASSLFRNRSAISPVWSPSFADTLAFRNATRRTFEHYVSPVVVREMLSHPELLELGLTLPGFVERSNGGLANLETNGHT